MKNSNGTKCGTSAILPLLVHTKAISFEWGKSDLNCFCSHAKKLGFDIRIMYHWQEVFQWEADSPLIILGIDEEWLKETLQKLVPLNLKIILIGGVTGGQYHNVSHLLFDQQLVIQDCLKLLQSRQRTHTALFGIQEKDTSDATKAEIFGRLVSLADVYWYSDDINACFELFYANLAQYDSVICANDIIAIYFLERCRQCGITVPQQLYLMGNCNIWLSSRVSPSLTTISYNLDTLVDVAIQLWRNLLALPYVRSMEVCLECDILERVSTEVDPPHPDPKIHRSKVYDYDDHFFHHVTHTLCPKIREISNLNQVLSACSSYELTILQRLAEGCSYETIAKESFHSVDTVKYYVKKLYRSLNIHKRQELVMLLEKYGIRLI